MAIFSTSAYPACLSRSSFSGSISTIPSRMGVFSFPNIWSRYRCMICMNWETSRRAVVMLYLLPFSFSCLCLSLASASVSTATKGPLPDRYTARSCFPSVSWSDCLIATFSPTSVLPAPGTPVTKQILLPLRSFVSWMTCITYLVVLSSCSPSAS